MEIDGSESPFQLFQRRDPKDTGRQQENLFSLPPSEKTPIGSFLCNRDTREKENKLMYKRQAKF